MIVDIDPPKKSPLTYYNTCENGMSISWQDEVTVQELKGYSWSPFRLKHKSLLTIEYFWLGH